MSGLVPFNKRNLIPSADDFNNLIEDFFNDRSFPMRSLSQDTFKMDVSEDETSYTVDAEMPGIKKDEIDLSINDGYLTISVEREETDENEDKKMLHRERRYTSMKRSLYLNNAAEDDISAKLEDGILKLTIPKIKYENEGQKKIEIE